MNRWLGFVIVILIIFAVLFFQYAKNNPLFNHKAVPPAVTFMISSDTRSSFTPCGCSIPLGVYSYIENGTIHIHAILCNLNTTKQIKKTTSCPADQAMRAADSITQQILDEGGKEILEELRNAKKAGP